MAESCINSNFQISIASIKRAESGKNVLYRIVANLAKYFKVPISDLLENSNLNNNKLESFPVAEIITIPSVFLLIEAKNNSTLKGIENYLRNFNYHASAQSNGIIISLENDLHGLCAFEKVRRLCLKLCSDFHLKVKICIYSQDSTSSHSISNEMLAITKQLDWGEVIANQNAILSGFFIINTPKRALKTLAPNWRITSPMATALRMPKGRHWELNQMNFIFEQVLLLNSGLTVCVTGCGGIGKTHLINYFFKNRSDLKSTIFLESGEGSRASSCRRFCLSLLLLNETSKESLILRKITRLKLPINITTWLQVYLTQNPEPSETHAEGWHKYMGIVLNALLASYAHHQHNAIFIDDIHCIDGHSENFLPLLVNCIKTLPIFLVLSGRNINSFNTLPKWLDQAYAIQPRELNSGLLRLIADEEKLTKKRNPSHSKALVRSGGNPRVLRQLMLCRRPDKDIPTCIANDLFFLIKHLNGAEITALKMASLLGENFSVKEFHQCLSQLLGVNSNHVYYSLISHGLLKLIGNQYGFQQPIIREVICESLKPAERIRLLNACDVSMA